jgi:hypothetical protein
VNASSRTTSAPPAAAEPGWEVPVPLTQASPPPPFPIEVFPGWLADMVTAVARFNQVDLAMAGAVALSVLSACAGGRLEVEALPGWREPTNLFIAVVAEPGERKSPVHGALTAPLLAAEQSLAAAREPLAREADALRDIANRNAEQAKSLAAKATPEKREELIAQAVAAALAAEAITVPTLPRLFADDATPEALTSLMAGNGGRMALLSDEGGIFDHLAGRYSSAPNLDPYLKGHAGQPMRVDRKGRDAEFIARPALTVGVMIQPSVLRRFGANPDMAGRGLVARFLFVLPTSLAGWRETDPDPIPEPVTARYVERVHGLAATLAEWEDPAVIPLTDTARAARSEFAAEVEVQFRDGGSLRDMPEWGNKLVGTTLRVAGLLHMAHHPGDGWRKPLDADRVRDAVRLAGFFAAHYRAATNTIATDPAANTARYVLSVLTDPAKPMPAFTRRELHRRIARQVPTAAAVAAVLDTLSAYGWIRQPEPGRYELHPRAAELAKAVDTLTTSLDDAYTAGQATRASVNPGGDNR